MLYQQALSDAITAHRAQLNKGFSVLRFDQQLEQEFRAAPTDLRTRHLNLSMLLLLAAGALFGMADFGSAQSLLADPYRLSLYLGSAVLASLMLAVGHGWLGKVWQEPLGILLALLVGPAGFVVEQLANTAVQLPLATFVVSTLLIYFCFGLRFWHAVFISALLFGCHAVYAVFNQQWRNPETLKALLQLLLPNAIGALVAYHIEYHERQGYLVEKDLKFQANHDVLTGLWNRRALNDHLVRTWAHCQREGQQLALALIDIDYFKSYNDTYGHLQGDHCLAEMGSMLRSLGQRPLDLVARYGGEEFAVLLPNCSLAQAERIMKQFQQTLAARKLPHAGSRTSPWVTVSVGLVSVVPTQALADVNTLLNSADTALYQAKSRGRNCLIATGELAKSAANDLRGAGDKKAAGPIPLRKAVNASR